MTNEQTFKAYYDQALREEADTISGIGPGFARRAAIQALRNMHEANLRIGMDPASPDGDAFVVVTVSKDGRIIGIEHPMDAQYEDVLKAHEELITHLQDRIDRQNLCPFHPDTPSENKQ